ncbi:hypothetical protein ACSBR2_036191 [Camellia fascicularis]
MVNFVNYGKSLNEGTDKFTVYGKGKSGNTIVFKTYGINNSFKDYAKKDVSFAGYINRSSGNLSSMTESDKVVNRRVEPSKFFRERMLKTRTIMPRELLYAHTISPLPTHLMTECVGKLCVKDVYRGRVVCVNRCSLMPMPNIRDKMPKRSFLPWVILSKLPFSTLKLSHMKKIFHASENSNMESILTDALSKCKRAPSHDENKWCVGLAKDLIDFAILVLGWNVVVSTTLNTNESVTEINGGKVMKSVSCHQSLFLYLLYCCHLVPQVRVYEVDILDPKTKAKINHGVTIHYVDTSAWSAGHGAFLALGSNLGKIEVCHWIFENNMTWSTTD